MKILYKVTSRSRPENLKRTLLNIQAMATNPDYLICVTLDENDLTVNNPAFKSWLGNNFGLELSVFYGRSKNKIAAINRDVERYRVWDVLVNVSDDQVFTVKGFDEIIRNQFYLSDTDLYLHFRDTNHNPIDALCTLSIIGRNYFERDGYIYHTSYVSVWADNESQDVAKSRGCYRFIAEPIFEHLHPAYGKAPVDSLYRKTESRLVHSIDHRNFLKRQKQGFPK